MSEGHDESLQKLLREFAMTGLTLRRLDNGTYVVDPSDLARKHGSLLARLREHRERITTFLEGHIATDIFAATQRTACPRCQQQVFVGAKSGQMLRHKVVDGSAWCEAPDDFPEE